MPSSWVNTECSIRRVQHTPSTAYTEYCLSSLHSLDFELTPECSFSFRRTSLQIDCHQPVLHKSFKGKVTSSHSHGFELTNRWIESQHLARLPSTASRSTTSKYSSNLPRSKPAASASLNSLDHSSECISEFTQSRSPIASPTSLDDGLKVHLQTRSITASKCISEFTPSRPPSASPNSLDHGLPVHLQTRSITASKCISQLARLRPPSTSLMSDGGCTEIQGYWRWTFTRSSSSGAPRIADNHHVLPVQLYRV